MNGSLNMNRLSLDTAIAGNLVTTVESETP